MKSILKYIFLLLIPLVSNLVKVQGQETRITGPRFGVDASGLAWHFVVPDRKSIGISADIEVKPRFYPVLEGGIMETNRKQATHDYHSKGFYIKMGFDHNFLEPKRPMLYDMLYGGFRGGWANYTHYAENITISSNYWGDVSQNLASNTIQALWLEAVLGVKTEVLNNIFFGWSLSGQLKVNHAEDNRMTGWLIPGYGKASKRTSLFVTYTISYRIPLMRR